MADKRKDHKGRTLKVGECQRKDLSYQYRYTDLLGKRHSVYSWRLLPSDKTPMGKKDGKSLREKENEIQHMVAQGMTGLGANITVNEMFEYYVSNKKHKGKSLTPNTIHNYKVMYNKNVRNSIVGNMKVLDVKKANIVHLYETLQEGGMSYGSITFFHKLLSSIFNMALDNEIKKFDGEKCRYLITPTKNTHTRKIPMSDDVYEVLRELRKYDFILRKDCQNYCVDGKEDFVFYTKSGKLLNDMFFNHELKRAVEKYNETAQHEIATISAHVLRHTGCTRDAEDGMDIKVLQYIMGHSNTQITNNFYNHVSEERAKNEIINLAERRKIKA